MRDAAKHNVATATAAPVHELTHNVRCSKQHKGGSKIARQTLRG